MRRIVLPLLLAAAALTTACTTVVNPVTGKSERTVMSEADEIAEGKKAHPQVLEEYGAYENKKVQAYVDQLGQRLAAQSHRKELKWTFTVLDSPEINAFALPGGYVYVTRGIMAYMESEADLAGVIGHEIGHVTARHGAQRATRQQTAGIGVLAATLLGAVVGAPDLANQLSQTAAAGYIASYSRDQELQADQLGAEYLVRNQYDPNNMVDVIQVLKSQEQFAADNAKAEGKAAPSGNDWLASHPSNERRLEDIRAIAAKYKGQWGDDFRARYLQAIEGMDFGDSAEQGLVRGQNFYHPPLGIAISAPAGWKFRNSPQALAIVNPAGDAGLVLQAVPEKAGSTHDEVIRNAFKATQTRTEKLSFNGLSATHFAGTVVQNNQSKGIEATVVTGPSNKNYALIYIAKDAAAMQRARGSLREAESTFRALNSADRSAAKPYKLRMTTLPAGGFPQLAKQSPLPNAERQLRLINGVYAGSDPAPGTRVKVVD